MSPFSGFRFVKVPSPVVEIRNPDTFQQISQNTMPEGPELHLASLFVNRVCTGVVFTGSVQKSAISKRPEVPFSSDAYCISAASRGKEIRLTLTPIKSDRKRKSKAGGNQTPMHVTFRFGMSGFFRFTTLEDLPKHAHLRFYTSENPQRVLSFDDPRRFGSWQPNGTWQQDRGPCVMFEYESFRENVLSNLSDRTFDRPICEAMLNQKYFNGIGNYLRAEILYRVNLPPFVKARTVLEGLKSNEDILKVKDSAESSTGGRQKAIKTESPDLLSLCNSVPLEVVNLGGNGYDPSKADYTKLEAWFQCYCVDGMNSTRDHNARTIWFKGDPGPMAPKGAKSSKTKRKIQKDEHDYTDATKGAKKKRADNIIGKKPEKKRAQIGKKEKTLPKRQRVRNQHTNRNDNVPDKNKRSKACKKKNSRRPQTRRGKSARGQQSSTNVKDTTKQRRKSRTAS